jgi:nucleoside-diphosphate-sugar epimerase
MQEVVRGLGPEFEITGLTRQNLFTDTETIKWLQGDLRSLTSEHLRGFDLLIHAAAITHTRYYRDYYQTNFLDSQRLFDLAVEAGVPRITYVSSRAAVPGAGGYGETKLLAEKYLKTLPVQWVIYKPAEIFGGLKNEGIENLITDVLTKDRVIYPAGNEKMYPLSLRDTAHIIRKELFDSYVSGKVQILNGPEGFTYKEAVILVNKISQRNTKTIAIPQILMVLIKYILRILPLNMGIVPDQIDRFYAGKPHIFREDIRDQLSDYILEVSKRLSLERA